MLEFQGLHLPSDSRIIDLIKIVNGLSNNPNNYLDIITSGTGNIYFRGGAVVGLENL